jgi:hypothetical protein
MTLYTVACITRPLFWFETDIKDSTMIGSSHPRQFIRYRFQASEDWKSHINIWDQATASEYLKSWMDRLQSGITLQVFAKADFQGGDNHVTRVPRGCLWE